MNEDRAQAFATWVRANPLPTAAISVIAVVILILIVAGGVSMVLPDSAYEKGQQAYDEYGVACSEDGYIAIEFLGTESSDDEINDYAHGCMDAMKENEDY